MSSYSGPVRRDNYWWIECDRPDVLGPIGPYATKKEAEEDMRGLQRLEKYGHLRNFVTTN